MIESTTSKTSEPCIFCPACGHEPALSQCRYGIQEMVDGRWRPVAGLTAEFKLVHDDVNSAQSAIDKLREYPEWTMAQLRVLPVHDAAPIRYLQPVTVGGWYETSDGRYTEFCWDSGRLLVIAGREAVSFDEYQAFKNKDSSPIE